MTAISSLNERQFSSVHADRASETIRNLQQSDPDKYWSVSEPEKGADVHPIPAHSGSVAGYVALTPEGKRVGIGGLVANPGHSGIVRSAMDLADKLYPDHEQHLDAFDGHLPKIYGKHGFQETGRVKFDDAYAPSAWKPAYGRPDVVFMSRPSANERRRGR